MINRCVEPVNCVPADDAAGVRGGGRHPLDIPAQQHPRTAFQGDPGLCSPRAEHLVSPSGAHGGEDLRTADEGRRAGGRSKFDDEQAVGQSSTIGYTKLANNCICRAAPTQT